VSPIELIVLWAIFLCSGILYFLTITQQFSVLKKSANSMRFSRQEDRALMRTSTSTPTVQMFWRIGGTMISSPCKTCDKKNKSKEDCYKECELLQAIQKIQLSFKENLKELGIDPFG